MEKQLFDWDGFDQHDTVSFSFYKVILKVPIGEYKVGDSFDSAFMDYENGKLEFYSGETVMGSYKLKLVIEQYK